MAKRGEYIDWLKVYQSKLHLTKKGNNYVALCPYHEDKNPSMHIMSNGNFKCFSCGEGGSVYKFIKDFELKEIKSSNLITELPQKETIIEFSEKPFTKEAHKYWNSFCLQEDFLKKENIFQVKNYAINSKLIKIPKNQEVFVFWAEDEDKVKLLHIGENVKIKWITNLKNSYLWYYYQYKEPIKDLFVVKSVKDRMVLKLLGYEGVALQNESATTFLKSNVEKIKKICEKPIICMGSDTQGFEQSVAITKQTGFRWFNSPKYMLRFGINDPASVCQEFGLEILDRQIKKDLKKWEIK